MLTKTLCQNGCGKAAIHITKRGNKHLCSRIPARCPAIINKMQETSFKKYGVKNASSLASVKELRKNNNLEKYGVDNVSKIPSVQKTIGKKRSAHWDTIYADKKFTVDGLTRDEYSRRCHQYAETQYRRNKHIIDPNNIRSRQYHLDHIYSITDGFLNDVPVNVISDISNLRLISATDNYKKSKKSEKSLAKLYEDYHLVSCL